jgi:hypothetical protein
MSCTDEGEVKMNLKACKQGSIASRLMVENDVDLQQNCATEKATIHVVNIAFCLRIQKGGPRICRDNVVQMPFTDIIPHSDGGGDNQHGRCKLMISHIASFQSYSTGHKRRPVSSCSKPRSSLTVGDNGLHKGVPSIPAIQLTTAGFKLAASSPRPPPAPFRSYRGA